MTEPKLTLDQQLRFEILVPFYSAMEKKRQEDDGKLTKQDASPIYTEAIKKIMVILEEQDKATSKEFYDTGFDAGWDYGYAQGIESEQLKHE